MNVTRYTTRNSTYEVEHLADGSLRVRRQGEESPLPHRLAERDVWHAASDVFGGIGTRLLVVFEDGSSTITSTVQVVEVISPEVATP